MSPEALYAAGAIGLTRSEEVKREGNKMLKERMRETTQDTSLKKEPSVFYAHQSGNRYVHLHMEHRFPVAVLNI